MLVVEVCISMSLGQGEWPGQICSCRGMMGQWVVTTVYVHLSVTTGEEWGAAQVIPCTSRDPPTTISLTFYLPTYSQHSPNLCVCVCVQPNPISTLTKQCGNVPACYHSSVTIWWRRAGDNPSLALSVAGSHFHIQAFLGDNSQGLMNVLWWPDSCGLMLSGEEDRMCITNGILFHM